MSTLVAQRDRFGETMNALCERDPRVVLLDGDLANSTKADKVATAHPERFFMMGIAEQNLAGVAAGLASVGLQPWVASFAAFLATRDLDQIRVVVAQPGLDVKLAAHYSGILTGYTGKTHQVANDIAIMRSLPHMAVVAPCDALEAETAMLAINRCEGPVYLRLTRDPAPIISDGLPFVLGRGVKLREGRDIAVLSTGGQTLRAYEAVKTLEQRGVNASLLHLPTIKPLDVAAVVDAAKSTGCVLTCEEHSVLGGLGGAVAEVLAQHHPTRVSRLGLRDVDAESGPNDALLHKYGLTADDIVKAACDLLNV